MARHRNAELHTRKSNVLFQTISMAGLALAVLAALVLIVVPRLTGSYTYTVLTSSMAPAYSPGTFLVVRPVPFDELRTGDVITYQIESGQPDVITHRVVAISATQQGKRTLITKGDNNSVKDNKPVLEVQVRGKLFYAVPHVGFLATAAATGREGLVQVIALGLIGYGVVTIVLGVVAARKRRAAGTPSVTEESPSPLPASMP